MKPQSVFSHRHHPSPATPPAAGGGALFKIRYLRTVLPRVPPAGRGAGAGKSLQTSQTLFRLCSESNP